MLKTTCSLIALMIFLSSTLVAADLYRVTVTSQETAAQLAATGVEAVVRTSDGYLVLADPAVAGKLTAEMYGARLLAADVSREQLAVDNRLDNGNVGKYPLVFQEGNLRIFKADLSLLAKGREQVDLAPLPSVPLAIRYHEAQPPNLQAIAAGVDLDSLMSLVERDSLVAYTERLQAYFRRVTGTDSCYASADWTKQKFQEFGYDSVFSDTFTTIIYSMPTVVENTVAVKPGTTFPNRYIIVGGHRDGVPASPAADDNGSGTAATLELARILKDIETLCTFIFITFSGEEQGLHGSWHYADSAAANGDSIIYMLNFDMIAHYENSTQARLYHGADDTYSRLWQDLADSLLGLDGVLSGSSGGSDHYPFAQHGYDVTFVHEYIFSTVYHSNQDSTTYMNFDYMTDMVKASLATVYAVMLDANAPVIDFGFPDGVPEFVYAEAETTFSVLLTPRNNAVIVPGSAMLHYAIDGGGYVDVALTEVAQYTYEASLPALVCTNQIQFYFSAEEQEMGLFYDGGPAAPYEPPVITELLIPFADNFESAQGWTSEVLGATSGTWQRGVPVNDPDWAYDPESDADGSGQCYLTQNGYGNTDVDDGSVRLTSPTFDMSAGGTISYWYYLYLTNTAGAVDRLLVEANNGSSGWIEIARHDEHNGLNWYYHEISDAELTAAGVPPAAGMQVRFTANDADPQSIVEAGIDGFRVFSYQCIDVQYLCGDADGSELVNVTDAVYMITYIFAGGPAPEPPEAGDVNCDEILNVSDAVYLIAFIFAGGPEPCADCP